MLTSCKQDTYWSSAVHPGVYKVSQPLTGYNLGKTEYYEITLNENHTFEIVRNEKSVFYGIIERRSEMYNNELKVWYFLKGRALSGNEVCSLTIVDDGTFIGGDGNTYQWIFDHVIKGSGSSKLKEVN